MRVRWIGLTLALALLAAAAGYLVGDARRGDPTTFAAAEPVTSADPSWPAEPVPVVPDSTFPPLGTGLRTHSETVGNPPFSLRLPIPDGWVRTNPAAGEWRWYPNARTTVNVYFLRVRLVGNQHKPTATAVSERLSALRGAAEVADLVVESTTPGGFTATYVADGHLRVAMEDFTATAGDTAYASIALVGREIDRTGMVDLFPRITAGATP